LQTQSWILVLISICFRIRISRIFFFKRGIKFACPFLLLCFLLLVIFPRLFSIWIQCFLSKHYLFFKSIHMWLLFLQWVLFFLFFFNGSYFHSSCLLQFLARCGNHFLESHRLYSRLWRRSLLFLLLWRSISEKAWLFHNWSLISSIFTHVRHMRCFHRI